MTDTFTPNYNLVLPGIGGDVNTWGTLLNENFSAIDTGMAANLDLAGLRTMTGGVKIGMASPTIQLKDTSQVLPAGLFRIIDSGGSFQVQRNTATAGDFSTSTVPFSLNNGDMAAFAGAATFASTTAFTGVATFTNGLTTTGSISVSNATPINMKDAGGTSHQAMVLSAGNTLDIFNAGNNLIRFVNQANTQVLMSCDASGNVTATGNVTAFSDERLKTDWKPLPKDFVEMAAQATVGTYLRKDTGERQAGTIAQEWLAILSEVIGVDSTSGLYTLAYGNAALVLAMELAKRVIALEARFLEELK